MGKVRILTTPTKVSDLNFAEFYDEISQDWESKARALQTRRWRALKRATKDSNYREVIL